MLVLSRKPNERIVADVNGVKLVVTVVETRAGKVRLGFTAPPDVRIDRAEVAEAAEAGVSPPSPRPRPSSPPAA